MNSEGTIITGSVRSGTTLALKVFCPDLAPGEDIVNGEFNEPGDIFNVVVPGYRDKVATVVHKAINKGRHKIIKSPHLAFVMNSVPPIYDVILTFRDLRTLIPSMFEHNGTKSWHFSDNAYWLKYLPKSERNLPESKIQFACLLAKTFYRCACKYQGPMVVWNYGCWEQWEVNRKEQSLTGLYTDPTHSSQRVQEDVAKGVVFSDASNDLSVWRKFCRDYRVSTVDSEAVMKTNEEIRSILAANGLNAILMDRFPRGKLKAW